MRTGRPLLPTQLTAGLLALACLDRYLGFLIILIMPIVAIWGLIQRWVSKYNRQQRKLLHKKLSIWLLLLVATLLVHWYYHLSARSLADSIVTTVEEFNQKEGRYPKSLQEAGLNSDNYWRIRYSNDARTGVGFEYMMPLSVAGLYRYNLEEKRWILQIDL